MSIRGDSKSEKKNGNNFRFNNSDNGDATEWL